MLSPPLFILDFFYFQISADNIFNQGVKFAKAKGYRVIGVDARDEGLALSKEYGADFVFDARKSKDEVVRQVQQVTGGAGVDTTICVSDHQDSAALGCAMTRMHGALVQIAQPEKVCIPFQELILRDIKIRGSLLCSAQESIEMLECVSQHGISVKTQVFDGLDRFEEMVDLVHSNKIKGKALIIVDRQQIEAEKMIGAKY